MKSANYTEDELRICKEAKDACEKFAAKAEATEDQYSLIPEFKAILEGVKKAFSVLDPEGKGAPIQIAETGCDCGHDHGMAYRKKLMVSSNAEFLLVTPNGKLPEKVASALQGLLPDGADIRFSLNIASFPLEKFSEEGIPLHLASLGIIDIIDAFVFPETRPTQPAAQA